MQPSPSNNLLQHEVPKARRFSMLKFRHASDPQLNTKYREHAETGNNEPLPLMLHPSSANTTTPRSESQPTLVKKRSRMKLTGRAKSSNDPAMIREASPRQEQDLKVQRRKTLSMSGPIPRVTFEDRDRPTTQVNHAPPAYGDVNSSALALPVNRFSESSRSDHSADHNVYATTTTHTTVHTTTTFFRLPRRKPKAPLFPLPPKVIAPEHGSALAVPTDHGASSTSSLSPSDELSRTAAVRLPVDQSGPSTALSSPSHTALARTSFGFAAAPGSPLNRKGSTNSTRSSPSKRMGLRDRSSTLSSLRNVPSDDALPSMMLASTRTSTSTGRKSFGDLFGLSNRLRQNSDVNHGPGTPLSHHSASLKEPEVVVPVRLENESPAMYLVRLEEAVSRGVVASVLSKGSDTFSQQVLRSYMRGFSFFGDPMDMAIRKLLMEVELPKETQQIDRCLQGFANRYHECNPGIYASPEQAYFIAFSLLILHTDVFNKNNKHKMTKQDYIKNTKDEGIFDEILECFYDNISYTPFIHVEDDMDINGDRILPIKSKKKARFPSNDTLKGKPKGPVDPYTLILERQLDSLRPNFKDVMQLEEHYNYLVPGTKLNMKLLLDTFFKTGVLQIKSMRSRPDAFLSDKTITNPQEATPGIVEIKVTKVGLLWRKDPKKKKARSPWQEWGAILTGAQLYFFRNTTWVKQLMQQQEVHAKKHEGTPVTFSPPLDSFQPDALMSTDSAVALHDLTYTKHKHAFLFVRQGGFEEIFLADNDDELADWMSKLNYASAFRTSGVRMRGVVGIGYDSGRARGLRRNESESDVSRFTDDEVSTNRERIDKKMIQDIMAARQGIMQARIDEWKQQLDSSATQLDSQLRNARHLQILAPIQARSRDHLILAAGRMSAKLKWIRLEIWRLRCHRDILMLDLAEENQGVPIADHLKSTAGSETTTLPRLDSQTTSNRYESADSNSVLTRPITQRTIPADNQSSDGIFDTPPALTSQSSYTRAQAAWELPPLLLSPMKFDTQDRRGSSAGHSHTSPIHLTQTSSHPSLAIVSSRDSHGRRAVSNPHAPLPYDMIEHRALDQSGLRNETPATPTSESPDSKVGTAEKDRLDRSKGIRRSLHKTLRDVSLPLPGSHVSGHLRSRKGKDSATTMTSPGDTLTPDDVLSRGSGSFTVHGKKASVITFGEEFSNMSQDDRMRARRNQRDDTVQKGGLFEEDFHSLLAEPIQYRHARESSASGDTTTVQSFRELHRRLSVHAQSPDMPTPGSGSVLEDGRSEVASTFEADHAPFRVSTTTTPPSSITKDGIDGLEKDDGPNAINAESAEALMKQPSATSDDGLVMAGEVREKGM